MKSVITLAVFIFSGWVACGQNLYLRAFGENKDKAIIFLHGGPGYNCVNFEVTTAQKLADEGFLVIVYDRRGEGRSPDPQASFTFSENFEDLNFIYGKFGLTKATLLGHSFGGIIATLFAEAHPEKVQSVVLVGAPVSLQSTFKNILARSRQIYETQQDSVNLYYISMLEKMDTASIQYSSYCFSHAMQNGFYSPKEPTQQAREIYSTFKTDTLLRKYASRMSYQAPQGFWMNEKYTTLDLTENLQNLQLQQIPVFGVYGKDDGLYSEQQITYLLNLLGPDNLMYADNCSHNVFIDQQALFIEALTTWAE